MESSDSNTKEVDEKQNEFNTREQLLKDSKENEGIQQVYEWAKQQMQKEKERLIKAGVEPIEVDVLEMSVIVQGKKKQINRIIFNSEFDFNQVDNILVSQSTPINFKPGYQYVNVVLYATLVSKTPVIFPYVYKTRLRKQAGKNNLKHWSLVNKNLKEAYHMISNFETIK